MNKEGRIENSIKNSIFGVAVQVTNVLSGLIVRTFFIHCLNAEYLGVNGLFSNILTVLSLAELGVGGAIVYNMYKPIANGDKKQIAKLMNLYRQAYIIIGTFVAIAGLTIIPFLDFIIKDKPNISNLTLIYILYLANTVFSYFFAYKKSIFSADQRERVISSFRLLFYFIRSLVQIIILIFTKNFIFYLLTEIICTLLENLSESIYADKCYPFLKQYRYENLEKEEKKPIFDNIKALFIYKIGSVALDGTDNIIISAFDGVISVGLLSNYTLITGSVQTVLYQITNSLTGSVGNFIAKESSERYEEMLMKITFFNFLIYGICFVGMVAVMNPFISVWAGNDYLLSEFTVFIHCLNVYIYGMMNSIWTFRSTMGLFVYGKWRPLVSAIINIVVSILLARSMGILGVLFGTTITRLITNVWYDPLIVYKHGLKKKPYSYYFQWTKYLCLCILDIIIIRLINIYLNMSGIVNFIFSGVLSVFVFLISVVIFFSKTKEFEYSKTIIKNLLNRIKK